MPKISPLFLLFPFLIAGEVDYAAFSLEELLDLNLVTLSKPGDRWRVPGLISEVSAHEMEVFGARTLHDILARLPGFPENAGFPIRRFLLLINGRPLAPSHSAGYLVTFPLGRVERLEVKRGPVLHGANSFEGTINIITKKEAENQVTVEAGSFLSRGGALSLGVEKRRFAVKLGLHYQNTERLDFSVKPAFREKMLREKVSEDNLGLNLEANYKDFWLSLSASRLNSRNRTASHSNLGYRHQFPENWRFEVNLTRDRERFPSPFSQTPRADDLLAEITVNRKFADKGNLQIGASYQRLRSVASAFGSPVITKSENSSAHVIFNYQPNRFLDLLVGGQFNKTKHGDHHNLPWLGGTFQFSPGSGLKLLWGETLGPSYRKKIEEGVSQGTQGLGKVAGFDSRLFVKRQGWEMALSYHQRPERRLIQAYPSEDRVGNSTYGNQPYQEGFELEARLTPNPDWYILGSLSSQANHKNLNPEAVVKAGLGYSRDRGSFALFASAFRESTSKPLQMLDANLVFKFEPLAIEIFATNLLDKQIQNPEKLNPATLISPGRAFYGTLKIRF